MLQVLFALNKTHWLNEKGAVAIADNFEIKPADFQKRANEVFGLLKAQPEAISQTLSLMGELNTETKDLLKNNRMV